MVTGVVAIATADCTLSTPNQRASTSYVPGNSSCATMPDALGTPDMVHELAPFNRTKNAPSAPLSPAPVDANSRSVASVVVNENVGGATAVTFTALCTFTCVNQRASK